MDHSILTVAANVNLVRKLGDGHIKTVLHAVQSLGIGLVGDESDGQSFGSKTTSSGHLIKYNEIMTL